MRVCKHGCGVKLFGISRANHASTNLKQFSSSKLKTFTLFTYSLVIVIYFIITIPQLFITLFAHIYLFIFIFALCTGICQRSLQDLQINYVDVDVDACSVKRSLNKHFSKVVAKEIEVLWALLKCMYSSSSRFSRELFKFTTQINFVRIHQRETLSPGRPLEGWSKETADWGGSKVKFRSEETVRMK